MDFLAFFLSDKIFLVLMTFEYFCGILGGHFSFFFITQFEKGLVCVPQLPVAPRRNLPIECSNHGGRQINTSSDLVAGPRVGVPR